MVETKRTHRVDVGEGKNKLPFWLCVDARFILTDWLTTGTYPIYRATRGVRSVLRPHRFDSNLLLWPSPFYSHVVSVARLKVTESELSAQQEKNVLVAVEYAELVKNLEQRQREDSLQVIFHGRRNVTQVCSLVLNEYF